MKLIIEFAAVDQGVGFVRLLRRCCARTTEDRTSGR